MARRSSAVWPAGIWPIEMMSISAQMRSRSPSSQAQHIGYSTTFGTRKNWSSVAGALRTMSSRDAAVGHHVLALLHRHRRHRGHRLDALDIHLAKLLDERQHGVELALQVLDLIVGDRDARQMRDTADGGGIDGHENLLHDTEISRGG